MWLFSKYVNTSEEIQIGSEIFFFLEEQYSCGINTHHVRLADYYKVNDLEACWHRLAVPMRRKAKAKDDIIVSSYISAYRVSSMTAWVL